MLFVISGNYENENRFPAALRKYSRFDCRLCVRALFSQGFVRALPSYSWFCFTLFCCSQPPIFLSSGTAFFVVRNRIFLSSWAAKRRIYVVGYRFFAQNDKCSVVQIRRAMIKSRTCCADNRRRGASHGSAGAVLPKFSFRKRIALSGYKNKGLVTF